MSRRPSQRGSNRTANGKRFRARLTPAAGVLLYLGTFDTERRAALAHKLFRLWIKRGHDWQTIPRG